MFNKVFFSYPITWKKMPHGISFFFTLPACVFRHLYSRTLFGISLPSAVNSCSKSQCVAGDEALGATTEAGYHQLRRPLGQIKLTLQNIFTLCTLAKKFHNFTAPVSRNVGSHNKIKARDRQRQAPKRMQCIKYRKKKKGNNEKDKNKL